MLNNAHRPAEKNKGGRKFERNVKEKGQPSWTLRRQPRMLAKHTPRNCEREKETFESDRHLKRQTCPHETKQADSPRCSTRGIKNQLICKVSDFVFTVFDCSEAERANGACAAGTQ